MPPLISVVIPTFGRPEFLPEAVLSALDDMGDAVEVVVVPNGENDSWRQSLKPFAADRRVRVAPISRAHANAARNHGMQLARGTYIRFLDDDDLLAPGASRAQCEQLELSGAAISSGAIELIDARGSVFRTWAQPATTDFVESVLMPGRVTAVNAHVFRRSMIQDVTWSESIPLGQDTHFMHSLCRRGEWAWVKTEQTVGMWRHHAGPRTSSSARTAVHLKLSANFQLDTIRALQESGRFGGSRPAAAAAGLWRMIHRGFPLSPLYWARVIRHARKMFPHTHPDIPIYRSRWVANLSPLLVELLMLPKRHLNYRLHALRVRAGRVTAVLPP